MFTTETLPKQGYQDAIHVQSYSVTLITLGQHH